MEKVFIGIGGAVAFCGMIIFIVPLSAGFGALCGWIVGWFFGDTILGVLGNIGLFLRTKVETTATKS